MGVDVVIVVARIFHNVVPFDLFDIHSPGSISPQLLELWNSNYKDLRMVDTKQFQNMKDPMELSRFQHICMNHIESAKEKLLKQ